jgi:hypothetical protein
MSEAMNALYFDRAPACQLHLLRGMQMAGSHYPFASLDSTDVARNHNRPRNNAAAMAAKWDAQQCPAIWMKAPTQMEMPCRSKTYEENMRGKSYQSRPSVSDSASLTKVSTPS